MLTVPESIKELLHQDTCRKNTRIHFPNGERSDICNNLIVKDTISFTESLCSQETLKFGLCEAPIFECETVGVGNIKGATIDVSVEIFCDADVPGSEWKVDLQAYVYAIPYGTFIVESCQRQADLIHRRIIAYGGSASADWGLSFIEKQKGLLSRTSGQTYQTKMFDFIVANLEPATFTPNIFDVNDAGFNYDGYLDERTITWKRDPAQIGNYSVTFRAYYTIPRWPSGGLNKPFYGECFVRLNSIRIQNAEEARTWIKNRMAQAWASESLQNMIANLASHALFIGPSNGNYMPPAKTIYLTENPDILTYYANASFGSLSSYFIVPAILGRLEIILDVPDVPGQDTYRRYDFFSEDETRAFITSAKYYEVNAAYSLMLNISKTFLPIPNQNGGYNLDYEDFDSQTYLSELFELGGLFGAFMRDNSLNALNIKQQFGLLPANNLYPDPDLYPEGVTGGKLLPNDYQSCWYDDEYTKPFGVIQCIFKDSGNNENIFMYYLTGYDENSDINSYGVYDLSDNAIIQNGTWTTLQIQAICEAIAANIDGVTYMPVEFVGRGLPYVEIGDTFEILTKSNDSITTIVLHRILTGDQTLTDTYKSNGA